MIDTTFKSYLLGTATESERSAIDRSLLTNDEVFEQILLAEDELIEAYLQKELSVVEQTQFEQCFLMDPERQQKLQLARGLHRYANNPINKPQPIRDTTPPSWWMIFRRPVWQLAIVCLLLLVAVICIRSFLTPPSLPQVAQTGATPTQPVLPIPTGTKVLDVELFPGQVRAIGPSNEPITVSADTGTITFKLHLSEASYQSYEVILQADDEDEIKLPGQVKPHVSKEEIYVTIQVPAATLGKGGYRIKLNGITEGRVTRAEGYFFTVTQ